MGSASARDDGQQGIKYHFVEHLTSVPSVNFLCFATAECYNALKKRSALAAIALGAVEKCASHAYACVGKPAVEQLSGPLKVADDLACKVLQKLENNYPVTIKMPHEIIGDARDFGTRKYTNGRDYVREKVDVCRDLSERVLKAACQPAETATSFVRCTRATVWQELAVAESACDACIKNINEDCTSEAHPRNYTLPRIFRLLWKASICVSQYAITEHRRVNDLIGKVFATAESVLEEPAEPLHRPTRYILHTTIEHGGAAFRHVVKLSTQLWRVYVDAFVLLYRTVWTSLSALLCGTVCSTEPINPELLYDGAPARCSEQSKDGGPVASGVPEDLKDGSPVASADPEDLKDGSPARGREDLKDGSPARGREDLKDGSPARGREDLKDGSPARGREDLKDGSPARGREDLKDGSPVPSGDPEDLNEEGLPHGGAPDDSKAGCSVHGGPPEVLNHESLALGSSSDDSIYGSLSRGESPEDLNDETLARGSSPDDS